MEKSFELWRTITPRQRNAWCWREPCSAGDCSRCYGLSRHSQVTPRVALARAKRRRRAAAFQTQHIGVRTSLKVGHYKIAGARTGEDSQSKITSSLLNHSEVPTHARPNVVCRIAAALHFLCSRGSAFTRGKPIVLMWRRPPRLYCKASRTPGRYTRWAAFMPRWERRKRQGRCSSRRWTCCIWIGQTTIIGTRLGELRNSTEKPSPQ